jgi:hypothetical protein
VAENIRLSSIRVDRFSSFRFHINLSDHGRSSFPVSSISINKWRAFNAFETALRG